jgi:hypothetical protein
VTNYWIFKVKDEVGGLYGRRGYAIFEHRTQEGFWAIKERSENGKPEVNLPLLKQGDHALFYLVHKDGGRFIGNCILDSAYTQLDETQKKLLIHRDFIDSDQGVFVTAVDKWSKPLPIECLKGKEAFAHRGGKVRSHFQGGIKKIDLMEYEAILHEHKLTF